MKHAIRWRRLDLPGHEHASLKPRGDGWELSGSADFVHDSRPCTLEYVIQCDAGWGTTSARVGGSIGTRAVELTISADEQRPWRLNDVEQPAVAGCIDIDLAFSPATNLLPIRRLALDIGQEANVVAAWLVFPAMTLQPLAQNYRRDGAHTYRYTSDGGRFVRTLEVNEAGFVTNYPGLWEIEPG